MMYNVLCTISGLCIVMCFHKHFDFSVNRYDVTTIMYLLFSLCDLLPPMTPPPVGSLLSVLVVNSIEEILVAEIQR